MKYNFSKNRDLKKILLLLQDLQGDIKKVPLFFKEFEKETNIHFDSDFAVMGLCQMLNDESKVYMLQCYLKYRMPDRRKFYDVHSNVVIINDLTMNPKHYWYWPIKSFTYRQRWLTMEIKRIKLILKIK